MSFERVLNASNIVPGFAVGLPPPVDPVELLPPSRRPLLLSLRQRSEDAQSLVRPLYEQLDELRPEKHLLSARLGELRRARGQGGPGLDDDDVQVRDAQRKLDAVDAEMARLNELVQARQTRSRNIAASVANCEDLLREGRPGGTEIVEAAETDVASVLKKRESPMAVLDGLRLRLRELAADAHRVESAPFPAAHAKARARATIEQLAARGTVDVGPLVEADLDIVWPTSTTRSQLVAVVGRSGDQVAGSALGEQVDAHALAAWLFRDAMIEKVEAEIDLVSDDAAALSREDRQMKLAEIAQNRLSIERQEAALVWRLQGDGLPVEHRPDANPLAVMGIALQVVTAEPERSEPWGQAAAAGRIVEVR